MLTIIKIFCGIFYVCCIALKKKKIQIEVFFLKIFYYPFLFFLSGGVEIPTPNSEANI